MPEKSGQYPISPADVDELHRLSLQDELLNNCFPLFPPHITPQQRVLDVACGTGGWLRTVAQRYPDIECIGLDKSALLLDRAKIMATNAGVSNVTYKQGDFFDLLKIFQSTRFDVIYMRCSTWFLGDKKIEVFTACQQLLKPGGAFCVLDFEQPFSTNSEALRKFHHLFFTVLAMRGVRNVGMSEFPLLFRKVGFEQIALSSYPLDLSAGAPGRDAFMVDLRNIFVVYRRMILDAKLVTEEEYNDLKQQALTDIDAPNFAMLAYALLVSGQRS